MDIEKTIEFILEQQAQWVVRLQAVTEQQAQNATEIQALTRQQAQFSQRLERIEADLETLTRVVGHHQAQIGTILDALATLTETQRMLSERMDSLIRIFEDWIRRSGDGSRPN